MELPNARGATIDPAKVRDYLLSPSHPIGRFKAAVFVALGYSANDWEVLRDDLLTLARTGSAVAGPPDLHGTKFEVDGILATPSGRAARFRTVWIVRAGEQRPRFVTAYPKNAR